MTMHLVEQANDFVEKLFKDKLSSLHTYHNLKHTTDVVAAVNLLVTPQHIDPSDREILLLAAWFHDTGYINAYDNHEESSVVIATDFLKEKGKSADYIEKVVALIRSTAYGYMPETLFEKIIKDADYYHLSSEDYVAACNALRLEWRYLCQKTYSEADWINENLDFLTNRHHYYTDFALKNWQPQKDKNIKSLLEKREKEE